jgi:hypothetical protein
LVDGLNLSIIHNTGVLVFDFVQRISYKVVHPAKQQNHTYVVKGIVMTDTGNALSLDTQSAAKLAAEMGMSVANNSSGTNASRLPELKINSQVDDENGNPIPRGQFYIKGLETIAYAESVNFRPLGHHFQYLHYDTEAKKLANKSVIMNSFREEARDIKGGIRCGKPKSSVLRDLPQEQRDRYADITCFRQVRGLVSYKGKTVDGEEVVYENQPVILMLKGTNFNPFEDEFMKVIPRSRNLWDYQAKLTSKRHKNGSVTWFTFHFAPDLKTPLGLDETVMESIKAIRDAIRSENDRVNAAYKKALRNDTLDQAAIDALEGSLDADLVDVA